MKQPKEVPILWPKIRSAPALKRMSTRALLAYARDIHNAHAENYRRSMEWDLFWAEFYRELLRRKGLARESAGRSRAGKARKAA